ncbi:MAG: TonB-dependent receptor [Gammaproteobacteria bacterium]|nr:TonB-dependent receptor [Gammaproteobacteria bacterium]
MNRNQSSYCFVLTGLAVAIAGLLPASVPVAAAANAPNQVEEIFVTAERRETNLQQTPIAIKAFTSERLDDLGIQNLGAITSYAPNVEISPTKRPAGGTSAIAAFIRGVGTGDFLIPTDPAIGLYVDGVYIARTVGGLMSIPDIERVEVLKGPQGTLFGRNTLGGAINVVTTQPSVDGPLKGRFTVRAGSHGRRDAVVDLNGPLVEGVLGAKFSVATLNFNGWQRNLITNERYGTEGRIISRGSLLWDVSDTFSLQLTGDYTYQRQKGTHGQLLSVTNTLARPARFNSIAAPVLNPGLMLPADSIVDNRWATTTNRLTNETSPSQDDQDIWGMSLVGTYSLTDSLRLKSTTAYRELDSFIQVAGDGTPYPRNAAASTNDSEQFSQELELSGSFLDGRATFVLGAYYFDENASASRIGLFEHGVYQITARTSDARDRNDSFGMDATSYAAFGQVNFQLTDDIDVFAGGRINKDKKTYSFMSERPEIGDVVTPLTSDSDKWTAFTPRVGINWQANDDVFVYASYAEGFKSGGFGNPLEGQGIPSYDPEDLTTWELGLKSTLFDDRMTFNAAVFTSKYQGTQITVIIPPNSFRTTQNGGDARIRGFEVDFEAVAAPGLTLNASVGYNHARFTSVTPDAVEASARDGLVHEAGTPLPYVPDWSATFGATYEFPLGDLGNMSLRGTYSYKSSTILKLADPDTNQPEYGLLSARIGFVPTNYPQLEFSVVGTNLTDKEYYYYRNYSGSTGNDLGAAGDPRLFYFQVNYRM